MSAWQNTLKWGQRQLQRQRPQPTITPRRMGFDFKAVDAGSYWFDNDPVLTHVLNILSLTFPDGERFFVDSVRALRERASPDQQAAISGFIGQEAMHSLEHQAFNQKLTQGRHPQVIRQAEVVTRKLLARGRQWLSPRQQLAVTAGLEHITAILADALLQRPDLVAKMDPAVRDLWVWHAIEETEHKAVAFDLYQTIGGSYRERQRFFLSGTAYLIGFTAYFSWQCLKQDGVHRRPLTLAKGLWKGFGYRGVVSSAIPAWLQYLKPGFQPWEDDNQALIEQWRTTLEKAQDDNVAA